MSLLLFDWFFLFKADSNDDAEFSFHSFITIRLKFSTDVNKNLNMKRNIHEEFMQEKIL